MTTPYIRAEYSNRDAGSIEFMIEKMLTGKVFIELACVNACDPAAQTVDVTSLVNRADPEGKPITHGTVYGVRFLRWQCGGSAIIMNPEPGDIGLFAVCDRDISLVVANRRGALAGSQRRHSRTDGVYLGGLLNAFPTQYLELAKNAINIVTPNPVNVSCHHATLKAPEGVTIDTPLAAFTGDIVDHAGSNSVSLKDLRDHFNRHRHDVQGVESGSSRVTSAPPDIPTE
ncbi:hypothetical protein SGGMMB4_01765 [Sodalis glossinidius str. 'morsitans']|uniref:Phage protein Gp138 N-terminal domain-containing protein n=1 Tax=Sodalis glossinidius (strain morsitans) TaxID=343509 RepID=A0A193QI38_SODGM|nr:phage baseplate protein [Sodalis glossinidius]CRL44590.1 hypothetical protein SGGMMB4_01765 [Sodalis glossinidius str. 'morsitans']